MVQFNELRITPDGKHLIIDVQVQSLDYYTNVYLDKIVFDTHETYNDLGPTTNKAVSVYTAGSTENTKHVRIFHDIDTLQDSVFFVYVKTKGNPSADTPCGLKNSLTMGIAYDSYPLYSLVMKGLREIDGCTPASGFMDFLFRLKAFEFSLKAGQYTTAIKYWKKFFVESPHTVTANCGCNG